MSTGEQFVGMDQSFYITTPIYYVNDVPHIGHAYTTIAADVLARYRRLMGADVFFLTGLDEHGQKVQRAAQRAGIDPKPYCDQLAPQFQALWKKLNISNNAFIRTTDPGHQDIVRTHLQSLYDKKLIYAADYRGWYCTADERFWTEKDAADGLCPDCKRPLERLTERNYFFKMSQYQERLLSHLADHPDYVRPKTRRNEVLGFLQKPLEDLSISRPKSRLSWGIELPFDPDYVTYVWFDALVNYVSALDYLPPTPSLARYWPASLHLVGKDILTTHAIYWSTILMALELPLPRTIFAHGWWTLGGAKMSKTEGNVVDPYALVEEFGADAFRYFLLREVPFGNDGDFSREALMGRLNTELANDLGNLLNRTLTLLERSADGVVPEPTPAAEGHREGELRHAAAELLGTTLPQYLMTNALEFNRALEAIGGLVQLGNQYIDKTAPWTLAKKPEDGPRLRTVLYHAAELLRVLSLAITPFMPQAAGEMRRQLGLSPDLSEPVAPTELAWGGLAPGTRAAKGSPLFPRVGAQGRTQGGTTVDDANQASSATPDRQQTGGTASTPAPEAAQQITIADFQKIHLRAATILQAERVPKSTKLLKLQVDLGTEQRQIVAGIGKKYDPESLVGRKVVVVANLKPAKLMGVESQGMVLAAGDKDVVGIVALPEDVDPGTIVK